LDESDSASITGWIEALKAGDSRAEDVLWQQYFQRVFQLARRRLGAAPHRTVEDAEDAAVSVFYTLYAGVSRGRFNQLNDRVDLWRLLTAITMKKVPSQKQHYTRLKRSGGFPNPGVATTDGSGPDAIAPAGDATRPHDSLTEALSKEPTPEYTALFEEEYSSLLAALGDKRLEQIAVWRMEGLSNEEIAGELKCAVRTVERKLERIRAIWTERGLAP
jgi:DNA-directed RNA polymerase specialized sigma24 family protein